MSLKVVTDLQCDADGCTTTTDLHLTGPVVLIKSVRQQAARLGWTVRSGPGRTRWYHDFCPEHSPPKETP